MRKYQPSNGTEGCIFTEKYCEKCVHEQFMHSQNHDDKTCDILSRTILHNIDEPEYPTEWVYDERDIPTCTAFQEHEWKKNELGEWIEPEFKDPSQLNLF